MLQLKTWSSQINRVVQLHLSEKVSFDGNSKELREVTIVDLGEEQRKHPCTGLEAGVCVKPR